MEMPKITHCEKNSMRRLKSSGSSWHFSPVRHRKILNSRPLPPCLLEGLRDDVILRCANVLKPNLRQILSKEGGKMAIPSFDLCKPSEPARRT